jgi:hypothetical protein
MPSISSIRTGIVKVTGLMQTKHRIPLKLEA